MRTRGRLAIVALCLLAAGAGASALLLFSGQSAKTRRSHIETTAAEIRHGNYFAWGQVWMWLEKLTPEEKKLLLAHCAQYASTNRSLQVSGCEWPLEPTSARPSATMVWIRQVAGMKDDALTYDVMMRPPFPAVQVARFEPMYTSPYNVAP